MKSLFIILSLFSVNALACPNLTGGYTCNDSGQTFEINISMTMSNGTYIYNVDGQEYIADNQPHLLPDQDGGSKNMYYIAKCDGEKLKSTMGGDAYDGDKKMGTFLILTDHALDAKKNLTEDLHFTFNDNGGTAHNHEHHLVCKRN